MPYLILAAILAALFFLWRSASRKMEAGLPGGQIVYTDTKTWKDVDQPLYDPVWDLTGKPDYLIRQEKMIIPVEVKTGRTPTAPYDSHIFQLAAYCLLVERVMGVRPSYGIIKYPQRSFQIEYTNQLEMDLKDLLDEMRAAQRKKSIDRSHEFPTRCRGCGFRSTCEQKLSF